MAILIIYSYYRPRVLKGIVWIISTRMIVLEEKNIFLNISFALPKFIHALKKEAEYRN
jgi:hypothetical protein